MKLSEFKKALSKPYFDLSEIRIHKVKIYNYQLSLWQKMGEIERLKNGLYAFSDKKKFLRPEEIAFLMYEPSYISLETALGFYGLIPEIVFSVTSVSTKTTRFFSNIFGNFSYRKIKSELFFGYVPYQTEYGKYLMAEPEKALLDYFYFNLGKINNADDISELRLNCDELNKIINRKKIKQYLAEYKIKKLERLINLLFELC